MDLDTSSVKERNKREPTTQYLDIYMDHRILLFLINTIESSDGEGALKDRLANCPCHIGTSCRPVRTHCTPPSSHHTSRPVHPSPPASLSLPRNWKEAGSMQCKMGGN